MKIQEVANNYWSYFSSQTNSWWAGLGISLAIGFVVGFVLKHYFKFLFWGLLISGVLFYVAQYFNIIDINYSVVNSYIDSNRSLLSQYYSYIANNISYLVFVIVGFIFAWIFA